MSFEQQTLPFSTPAQTRPNAVVEAGAGTGKTTRVVHDVVMLLLDQPELRPERIVLVTFTEKAAAEIAERVRWALTDLHLHFDEERVAWPHGSATPVIEIKPHQRERYRAACEKQMRRVDRLRSQTIHSFCQNILRLFPIEAGLDPRFRIVQGFEQSSLMAETYDRWFDSETLTDWEERLAEWEILLDSFTGIEAIRSAILALLGRRELIDDEHYSLGDIALVDVEIRDALRPFQEISDKALGKVTGEVAICIEQLRNLALPSRPELESWLALLEPVNEVLRDRDLREFPKELQPSVKILRGDSSESRRKTIYEKLLDHRASVTLRRAASRFAAFLDREKEARSVVDFDDLLLRTARLLENEEVLEKVRSRFDYIFVDEFQDTDRMQARIIDLLARDRSGRMVPGRTTLVGDPKQSIYSFRRADPETFGSTVERFIREGARAEYLDQQYRSTRRLVSGINAMFGALFPPSDAPMSGPVLRPSYQPLRAARGEKPDDPAPIRFIGARLPEGEDSDWVEAELIAEWISRNRRRDAVDLRRFAILMRKMTNAAVYADVFEKREIALILPPSRTLLDRRACIDLLAVLRAIAYPFDEAAIVAAARTPYFALSDDEIVRGRIDSETPGPWSEMRRAIGSWTREASAARVSQLVDRLVTESDIRTLYSTLKAGDRWLAHLERFRDVALEYDLTAGGSLRQFVDELLRRRTEADDAEPVLTDESENAVRIMTVHASKGLEFETVIIPDLSGQTGGDSVKCYATDEPPLLVFSGAIASISRHFGRAGGVTMKEIDRGREAAELDRLFYVAVTRAKSEVVFASAIPEKPRMSGFWKPLQAILGVAPPEFPGLFAGAGETVSRHFTVGQNDLEIPFEEITTPARIEREVARFRSVALAEAILAGTDEAPAIPIPEGRREPRHELLRTLAAARRRTTGIAMHRLLERWSFRSEELEGVVAAVVAELGLSRDESDSLGRLARRIAGSPVTKRIAGSEIVGRELPILFRDSSGAPREGRIDLLLRDQGRYLVVDYKSGEPYEERLDKDREQVRGYMASISAMSGAECGGMLWYIGKSDSAVEV
jgi:ATP-dependent helicase/nuclease subunit A